MNRALGWVAVLAAAAGGACLQTVPVVPPAELIPAPDLATVEHVYFLVGDPGEALATTHPILPRLQQDIEQWARALPGDSSVTLIVLGDLLYPIGMRERGTPEFPRDSAVLMGQVGLVAGPEARSRGVTGYFLAGNHDWGLQADWEGFQAVLRLQEFLQAAAVATGADVQLRPVAGSGGPFVVDHARTRLVLLDTAWWLQHADDPARVGLLESLDSTFAGAGEREVIIAAHHPFTSAGEHGGSRSVWSLLGFEYLLNRSGAILQDISSIPYRRLERGLRAVFARHGPPLVFAGGHEHNLQVIEGVLPSDPRHTLVSGSGSKHSSLGAIEGLRFAESAPGYMRLVIGRDGGARVYVEASPPEYQMCPAGEPRRSQCMAEGIASFRTVYSQRLH